MQQAVYNVLLFFPMSVEMSPYACMADSMYKYLSLRDYIVSHFTKKKEKEKKEKKEVSLGIGAMIT